MGRNENHPEDGTADQARQSSADALQMSALRRVHRALAHDLRAPFNTAFLQIELLRLIAQRDSGQNKAEAGSPYQSRLDRLERSLQQLRGDLECLVSQFESHDEESRIDLSSLVKEACAVCRPQAEHAGIRLEIRAHAKIGIRCRPDRIRAVVLGLLAAALDLASRDETLAVETSETEKGTTLQIEVHAGEYRAAEVRSDEDRAVENRVIDRERESLARTLAESENATLETDESGGRLTWRLIWPE